jgi:uridine kinase
MSEKTNIILICGGSCSGKTTLAVNLRETLSEFGSVSALSMDNYYFDLSDWDPIEADNKNFDCPDAVNSDLLLEDLERLIDGKKISERLYNYKTHHNKTLDTWIEPADFVIVEGIFTLYFEKLRSLASANVFVHADADIRLARRVERDIADRHLPLELVLKQYLQDVRPMHVKYIEPYSRYADLIINSNFTTSEENLEKTLNFLRNHLIINEKK